MRHLFDIPLGASYAPNAVHKRIFSTFGSIAAALINQGTQNGTNEMNYINNMMTNKANERINESQLAWAKEQYEQEKAENRFLVDQAYERNRADIENERAYNDPAAVIQRYRDAGINPYLASSLGIASGSSHGAGGSAVVGSPAHANQPNMIPMQNGAPMVASQIGDLGLGIARDQELWLRSKQEERSDYALASDIEVQHMNAYANLLKAYSEAYKNGVDSSVLKSADKRAWSEQFLKEDKFAADMERWNVENEYEQKRLQLQEMISTAQKMAVESGIALNKSQSAYLSQLIASEKVRNNLSSQETAQRIISMINQDAAIFERLGIDKDMVDSQKFKNYVSSVADAIATGAAVYFGIRNNLPKPTPFKPDSYLENFYKPW